MKKTLSGAITLIALATPAFAADPSGPSSLPAAVADPGWAGCYLGIDGGGDWGRASITAVTAPKSANIGIPITNDFGLKGILVGGTFGCNYQVKNWVLGAEGDLSWTNKTGTAHDIPPFTTTATNQVQERWIDTARGRIGYAWERALFYGTAGAAFASASDDVCTINHQCVGASRTRTGWVAGGGLESALSDRLSLKLEYLHSDLGARNYIDPPVVLGRQTFETRSIHLTDNIVRIGLNYRFGWGGPVIAKY